MGMSALIELIRMAVVVSVSVSVSGRDVALGRSRCAVIGPQSGVGVRPFAGLLVGG